MDLQFVIPSRKRSAIIGAHSLQLFPDALVCIAESEVPEYKKVTKQILVHPDSVVGLSMKRQWILDNVKAEVVFMADDDAKCLIDNTGFRPRVIEDGEHVMAVCERTAIAARDAGARLFGFAPSARGMWQKQYAPFLLRHWCGGFFGIIGRELKYDSMLKSRAEDIDLSLQAVCKFKFNWIDTRYAFIANRWGGDGGNDINRGSLRQKTELEYIKKKWGRYIEIKAAKSCERIVIHLPK